MNFRGNLSLLQRYKNKQIGVQGAAAGIKPVTPQTEDLWLKD